MTWGQVRLKRKYPCALCGGKAKQKADYCYGCGYLICDDCTEDHCDNADGIGGPHKIAAKHTIDQPPYVPPEENQ